MRILQDLWAPALTTMILGFTACGSSSMTRVIVVESQSEPAPKSHGQVVASDNHFDAGVKFYNRRQYKQAIKHFDKAIAKNPRNWEAHWYLGMCKRELGMTHAALSHFRYAQRDCPDDRNSRVRIYVAIGVTWELLGEYDDAAASFVAALELDSHCSEASECLARVKEHSAQHGKKGKKHRDHDD